MNSYDLLVAFEKKLRALTFSGVTVAPDDTFDPAKNNTVKVRRGAMLPIVQDFSMMGNGRSTRITGSYQIDIWVLRTTTNALQVLKGLSDAHLNHFYPVNGRGLALTEQQTTAKIVKRPDQQYVGRDGAYLREMIDVEFHVDIPAVG